MGQTNCYPHPREKVWWKIDKENITIHAYPKKSGPPYKPVTKHWKNICTSNTCKGRKGVLYGCQSPVKTLKPNQGAKGIKCSPEGMVSCSVCDADYCPVTGKDTDWTVRFSLQPSNTPSVGEVIQGKTNDKIILDSRKGSKPITIEKTMDITVSWEIWSDGEKRFQAWKKANGKDPLYVTIEGHQVQLKDWKDSQNRVIKFKKDNNKNPLTVRLTVP